jgi:Tripartite tricarboxylate transporter TctB family
MDNPSHRKGDDRPAVTMQTMEIVTAGALFAFGALVAWDSFRLGAKWLDDGPQSGYFPFYIGMIIVVSSAITLVQALSGKLGPEGRSFVDRGPLRQIMAVLVPALLYVLGIQLIGIYVSSAVYIAVFMVWLGKYSWLKGASLGIAISVLMYVTFEIWFQIALHKGTWFNPLSLIGY